MQFFLGVDGGGTRTRAFVTDFSGRQVGWGESGPGNPNYAARSEVLANLERAVAGACQGAEIRREQLTAVFAGLAGLTTDKGRAEAKALLRECGFGQAALAVDHDIRIALAGGLGGKPGIALIVGTGSACFGRDAAGQTWQTGGWEASLSDEGSGWFLGVEAMKAATRMADGRTPESPLRGKVFAWLQISHIAEILPRLGEHGLTRAEIAAFAPEVIELARVGDSAAESILDRGAELLAEMVAANHRRLPTGPGPDIVITGGLGCAPTLYRERVIKGIRRQIPSARIHPPLLPPVAGAALLAIETAGQMVPPGLVEELRARAAGADQG